VRLRTKKTREVIALDRKANRLDRNFIAKFYSAIRRFETGLRWL